MRAGNINAADLRERLREARHEALAQEPALESLIQAVEDYLNSQNGQEDFNSTQTALWHYLQRVKRAKTRAKPPAARKHRSGIVRDRRSVTQRQADNRKYRLVQYGLTPDDYEELMCRQQGRCAICQRESSRLYIDHCHVTGVVRGLLCLACNVGLGQFQDDPERISRAITYLTQNG